MDSVLFSGFTEVHCHLDKTLTIEEVGNSSGTLMEAIHNWLAFKPSITKADYLRRGQQALEMAIQAGTTRLRTHVDVDTNGFLALEAMLELREQYKARLPIQIVALGNPSEEIRTMRQAIQLGADAVGGCPAIRADGVLEIKNALEIAAEYRKPVDLHIDENDHTNFLELLADMVLETQFDLPVMAGHCCSLDFMREADAARVIEKVAAANISIVALPACNLNLQGRGVHPKPRGITRVAQLLEAGVNVCFASDNVQDPFQPVGNYDLLYAAHIGAIAAHLTHQAGLEAALRMVTSNADKALGLEPLTTKSVLLETKTVVDALRSLAKRQILGGD
ncbi:MAG: amidohydrolase family protein [Deinococcales bacterium]